MLRHRAQLLALVKIFANAIDDAVVELHPRHDLGVDRLGLDLLLRREGLAEGVRPASYEQEFFHEPGILRRVEAFGGQRLQEVLQERPPLQILAAPVAPRERNNTGGEFYSRHGSSQLRQRRLRGGLLRFPRCFSYTLETAVAVGLLGLACGAHDHDDGVTVASRRVAAIDAESRTFDDLVPVAGQRDLHDLIFIVHRCCLPCFYKSIL